MVKEKGRCIKWIVFTLAVIIAGFPVSYDWADTSGQNPTIVLDVEPTIYRYGQDITLIILDPDFGEIVENSKNYLPEENFRGIEKSYTCQGLATVKWDIKAKNGHVIDTVEELIMTDKLTITMIVPTPTSEPTATPVPTVTPVPTATLKPTPKPTPCYKLTVSVDPGEGGTITVSPDRDCYPKNSHVSISVNLSKNYTILYWGGIPCKFDTNCKFIMNSDTNVEVSVRLNRCTMYKNELAELKKEKELKEKEKQKLEKQLSQVNNLIKMHQDTIDICVTFKKSIKVVECAGTIVNVVSAAVALAAEGVGIELLQLACPSPGEIIFEVITDVSSKIEKLEKNIASYEKAIEQHIYDIWEVGRVIFNINSDITSLLLDMKAIGCDEEEME